MSDKESTSSWIKSNLITIFYAIIIALLIRTFLFQPFFIPSSSMEPGLLVGDRIFASKYDYGYSRHSFPFSLPIINGRVFESSPKRGDVVIFKPPHTRNDYIKRLIGLPGDTIQFIDGNVYLNDNQILKTIISKNDKLFCGNRKINVKTFKEKMPNGRIYNASYIKSSTFINSDKYIVPEDHYFFLGDNRDCSKDSRFLSEVGYVHKDNLVGKAQFLFFSSNKKVGSIIQFWKWNKIIRFNRFFKKIN